MSYFLMKNDDIKQMIKNQKLLFYSYRNGMIEIKSATISLLMPELQMYSGSERRFQ